MYLLYTLLIEPSFGHSGGLHDWPQQYEDASDIAFWVYEDDWYISPVRSVDVSGHRLGLFVQKAMGTVVSLEARFVTSSSVGDWQSFSNPFSLPTLDLLIHSFNEQHYSIQFRSQNPSSIQRLEWDILNPAYEESLPEDTFPPPSPTQLSQSLIDLGVISRSTWNARATTCTLAANPWYRMAIHHVASHQDYNGSIADRLQAIQAWAIDSNEYCDVPYQYLVGYDGTLYEGRPISLYSGATGGGHNNGNIALSFIGCYDQVACMNDFNFYHNETEEMMARAREIIQVLSTENGFTVDTTNIKGHREWPDNATACPGDFIMDRFDELLSPVPPYSGLVVEQSHVDMIELELGETIEVWVDITNTGQREWSTLTKLAPTPRDVDSPLAHDSWEAGSRVVAASPTSPEQTHRFTFTIQGNEVGSYTQYFTMLEELFTWFGDTPFAGSPSDTGIVFSVNVVETPEEDTNTAPMADAGSDQLVFAQDVVSLDGSYSMDPDGDALSFSWISLSDSQIILEDFETATPTFVASDPGEYEFIITVSDGQLEDSDTVMITVLENGPTSELEEDSPKSGCSQQNGYTNIFALLSGLLPLLLRRRRK
jgi:hypothetical protein